MLTTVQGRRRFKCQAAHPARGLTKLCSRMVHLGVGADRQFHCLEQLHECDRVCIDKSSSAELQEAINSMYRWYKSAEICYAYLSDVDTHKTGFHSIGTSMWFDRAWTLQELVVPSSLVFLSNSGARFGSRSVLALIIHQCTRIPLQVLRDGFEQGKSALVAEIMSWARFRQATRSEDHAYSLLGLFNVSMPLLYGEGCQAFRRLQEEILKQSQDQSIFVWH